MINYHSQFPSGVQPSQSTSEMRKEMNLNNFLTNFPESHYSMPPKKIHSYWVGSLPGSKELRYLFERCEKNPDWEIILWVDTNSINVHKEHSRLNDECSKLYPNGLASMRAIRKIEGTLCKIKTSPSTNDAERLKRDIANFSEFLPTPNSLKESMSMARTVLSENKEKLLLTERKVLDFIVRSTSMPRPSEYKREKILQDIVKLHGLNQYPNLSVRDTHNIPNFKNREISEYLTLKGHYAGSSDLARLAILESIGGVYADLDLGVTNPIDRSISLHPDSIKIGFVEETGYIANGVLCAHPNSKLLKSINQGLHDIYSSFTQKDIFFARHFDLPGESMQDLGTSYIALNIEALLTENMGLLDNISCLTDHSFYTNRWKNSPELKSAFNQFFKLTGNYFNFWSDENLDNSVSQASFKDSISWNKQPLPMITQQK